MTITSFSPTGTGHILIEKLNQKTISEDVYRLTLARLTEDDDTNRRISPENAVTAQVRWSDGVVYTSILLSATALTALGACIEETLTGRSWCADEFSLAAGATTMIDET